MNNQSILNRRNIFYLLMVTGGIIILVVSFFTAVSWVEVVSELIAVLGVEILVIEIYQLRKVAESEFLVKLNDSFISDKDYRDVYILLEDYDFENCPDLDIDDFFILKYLSFFETFRLLIDRGTFSFETLDVIFGNRFFVAVHNPYVQKHKLLKHPENYKSLFVLERDWMEYRKKHKRDVFREEHSLEKIMGSEAYNRLLSD